MVNRRRTGHGRRPVHRISPCVDRLSERWAAHLAETGGFYHRDQHVVLRRCHMHWAGEALARGTAMRAGQAVRAWMASPEHRAVILKRRARRAGLGVRLDSQGRVVLVLNFADPRA
nr:CAP domain-containing protein [Nocardioides panaciterrulae]